MFAEALDKVGSQPELVSWEARRSTALRVRVRLSEATGLRAQKGRILGAAVQI